MPWTIKNIRSSVGWGIRNIRSTVNWTKYLIDIRVWNWISQKWNEADVMWSSADFLVGWDKMNINDSPNTARDYEWDDSTTTWSLMKVDWDKALIEGSSSWVISTKDSSTWTKQTISD
jgi:hypothetical protein